MRTLPHAHVPSGTDRGQDLGVARGPWVPGRCYASPGMTGRARKIPTVIPAERMREPGPRAADARVLRRENDSVTNGKQVRRRHRLGRGRIFRIVHAVSLRGEDDGDLSWVRHRVGIRDWLRIATLCLPNGTLAELSAFAGRPPRQRCSGARKRPSGPRHFGRGDEGCEGDRA